MTLINIYHVYLKIVGHNDSHECDPEYYGFFEFHDRYEYPIQRHIESLKCMCFLHEYAVFRAYRLGIIVTKRMI